MHAIVCEDPIHELRIGEVVEGPNNINRLKNRGVALLPFDPQLPLDACGAYVQKFFGRGWLFNNGAGERGCQTMFDVKSDHQFIYWAARCRRKSENEQFNATIRLVHSSSQGRGISMGMSQLVSVTSTPKLDEDGSAIVYGKSQFTAAARGFMFVDLYCVARGLLVEWLAVTQCQQDYLV